jgi:hypothetical protein
MNQKAECTAKYNDQMKFNPETSEHITRLAPHVIVTLLNIFIKKARLFSDAVLLFSVVFFN